MNTETETDAATSEFKSNLVVLVTKGLADWLKERTAATLTRLFLDERAVNAKLSLDNERLRGELGRFTARASREASRQAVMRELGVQLQNAATRLEGLDVVAQLEAAGVEAVPAQTSAPASPPRLHVVRSGE